MQITNLKLETLPGVNPEAPSPAIQRQRNNSFDTVLQDANQRQAGSEPPAPRDRVERPGPERRDSVENYTYQEPVMVDEKAETYAPPEANEYVSEETAYFTDEAAPEFVKVLQYVAEAAALPAEAVKEWLVKENVKLHELQEPENLPKFVEYALGKKAPAELLTDPVLPEIHKAVQEAVELLKEPKKAVVQKEVVVQQAAKTATPVIKADIAGLEVVKKDGEVVVTDELYELPSQGEKNESSSNQSSTGGTSTVNQAAAGPIVTAPQGEAGAAYLPPVAAQEANPIQQQQIVEAARPALTQVPVNAQDVINQIMTQVKVASTGQNFTEMRMTLKPESLGEILLRVITQNGIVMAQFEAESQRIKETLESNFNHLRDALTEAGVAFGELNVFVRQEGEERLNQFERERLAARRRMESILAEEEIDETKDPLHDGILDEVA